MLQEKSSEFLNPKIVQIFTFWEMSEKVAIVSHYKRYIAAGIHID